MKAWFGDGEASEIEVWARKRASSIAARKWAEESKFRLFVVNKPGPVT